MAKYELNPDEQMAYTRLKADYADDMGELPRDLSQGMRKDLIDMVENGRITEDGVRHLDYIYPRWNLRRVFPDILGEEGENGKPYYDGSMEVLDPVRIKSEPKKKASNGGKASSADKTTKKVKKSASPLVPFSDLMAKYRRLRA